MKKKSLPPSSSTKIGIYTVELEFEQDTENTFSSSCFIENTKTGACASLACAEGEGVLHTASGEDEWISEFARCKISDWAQARGY